MEPVQPDQSRPARYAAIVPETVCRRIHAVHGGKRRFEGQSAARQALRALVRPFILRRTKSEVLTELPRARNRLSK
ncbi:MAG: hypothetical protein ACLR0N_03645 [Bilophila wadsworthia]